MNHSKLFWEEVLKIMPNARKIDRMLNVYPVKWYLEKLGVKKERRLAMDILDILLDEENHDSIGLADEHGTFYRFEQIAVIPYNDKIYCILKPISKMKNVEEDEAIVFYVDEKDNPPSLKVETDELTSLKVFNEYYDLLEERLNEEEEV